ncbi:hypothetical protein [Polynucleobacter sphagniphilus]|uniref:bestrophin-like domain n=1 Tax=Polynucleobacter sphagniphilus TaxID=1743169 RepID=UPI00247652D2|nr:hypothetical protein [Polynucleobacter sphagniphilus]MDH6300072.1 hypothetical protein [Polynucleobacter sphagniphilus]
MGIIQTATLTLLGLIIGFSFSMAIARYDQRKVLEEAEANAIGTEFLRADLLPPKLAATTKASLLDYVDQRINFYSYQEQEVGKIIKQRTSELHSTLWNDLLPVMKNQTNAMHVLIASGMNEVINSEGYTQAAWWNRIPLMAWGLMAAIAICANLVVGYGAQNFKGNVGLFMLLPFVIATSFFLIADIDSPRGGIIKVEPRNLIQLKKSLSQLIEVQAPQAKAAQSK